MFSFSFLQFKSPESYKSGARHYKISNMLLKKSVLAAVAVATLTVSAAFATVPAQTNACNYQFATNLRLGAVSSDVQNLQKLLNMDAATRVSVSGAGSAGLETFRFGPATFAAVKKFQAANGITPMSGYVGPLTRGVLNTICSSTVSNTNTNTNTGSGVVSNNIPVSVLVQGQAGAKLAEFVVSGNGSVTNVTLMRSGLSSNSTLRNVYLYDGMTRLTDGASVRNDGTISFNSTAGLFQVSGSKTITVRADISSTNASGQTVGVALTGVTMMGGSATPVTGANGPLFSISSAQTVTADFPQWQNVNPSAVSINAGSINQTLWTRTISIGTNPAKFHGITFKMIGSAPMNTLANVKLFVDGVERGMATANGMGQYVFALGTPVHLTTGSHTIDLRGDIVGGASRNFYMSLEQATDVMVEDSTLPGVNVSVTGSSTAATSITNLLGGLVSVNSATNGGVIINQNTSFNNTTTLIGNATQVTLGSWKFTAYSEDIKVTSLSVTAALQSVLSNVGLYVNGGQVGSNAVTSNTNTANVVNGNTLAYNNLGTNLYIPMGQSVTVELKGDVQNAAGTAATGTVAFNVAAGSNNAQGVTSSQLASTPAASGQSLTVASNNVTYTQTTGFSGSTKAPNAAGVKIGSYTVQTGSSEGIQLNQVTVNVSSGNIQQYTNLTLKDGSTVLGTPVGNITAGSNNFNTNLSIPSNTTKVLDVYADIGSSAAGSTVAASSTIQYRGLVSNVTNTATIATSVTTNVGTAYITNTGVTYNSGLSPVYQGIVGGQANYGIGQFNFKVNNSVGGAIIKDLTFNSATGTVSSITVNGKSASFSGGTATIYDVGINVPADAGGINVPATIGLVCVGLTNGCPAVSSSTVQVGIAGLTYNNGSTVDTGLAVGTTTPIAATSTALGLFNSKPSFSIDTTQKTGLNIGAENKIGEVTISADANGQIKVNDIAFNVAVAGLTAVTLSNARIADGNSTVANTAVESGCTAVGACVMRFGSASNTDNDGFSIAAGTSKTFSLYATVAATLGASVTNSISSSVTAGTTNWDDVVGGGTDLGSGMIYNFPTGSYSIRQ